MGGWRRSAPIEDDADALSLTKHAQHVLALGGDVPDHAHRPADKRDLEHHRSRRPVAQVARELCPERVARHPQRCGTVWDRRENALLLAADLLEGRRPDDAHAEVLLVVPLGKRVLATLLLFGRWGCKAMGV